jgi:hypothetical protein
MNKMKKNPDAKKDYGPAATMNFVTHTQIFNEVRARQDSDRTNDVEVVNAVNYFKMSPREIALNEVTSGKFKYNFMALYKSQNWLYNDSFKPNWSAFYLDSKFTWDDVVELKKELSLFANEYLVKSLKGQYDDYFAKKWSQFKSVFKVEELINAIFKYGINDGDWDESSSEKWKYFSFKYLDQTDWELPQKENWMGVPSHDKLQDYRAQGQAGWLEILRQCPYLEMIDFTVSSGFPHWRPQSMKHFYDYAGDAYKDAAEGDVMTLQSRTQGGTVKSELDTIDWIKYKVRAVLAAAFAIKVLFYVISYLWKRSAPDLTHYFKDGAVVMERVLKMIQRADKDDSLDVYNTDLSAADQTQASKGFGWNIDYYVKKAFKNFPRILSDYVKRAMRPLTDPRVLVDPRQILLFKKVIAPSGHSFVPPGESASVFASHVVPILEGQDVPTPQYEDWKNWILDILIQLDDVQELAIKHDLEFDAAYMRKHYGSIMSPSKTNVFSVDGWVEPLKVDVGFLYNEAGLHQELLDGSDPQDGTYLKFLPSGLRLDAERGTRDDGQSIIMLDEDSFDWGKRLGLLNQYKLHMFDGVSYYEANKAVQSLYGKLSSLGNKAPVSLYHMLYRRWRGKTWDNMIIILRNREHIRIEGKEWGFGRNDKLIDLLIDITERGVVNEN